MVLVIDIADFKMLKKYFLSFNIYLVEYNYITCILNYPAMTALTDQYSLPNIFFDIGQL